MNLHGSFILLFLSQNTHLNLLASLDYVEVSESLYQVHPFKNVDSLEYYCIPTDSNCNAVLIFL